MGDLNELKPAMGLLGLQFCYAGVSLSTRAALLQGMNPRIFVVYRQVFATFAILPIAYFSRRKSSRCSLDLRSFTLMFFAALFGVTIHQNFFFEGIYLASSSIGSAMGNLIPGITFIMASIIGLEKVNFQSLRSVAKILGTIFCVVGAISMALLRGPKILNTEFLHDKSFFGSVDHDTWSLGCLLLFASSCCWSFWLILQVPLSVRYPDSLSQSAWMCFFGALQSTTLAFFLEPNTKEWILTSYLELSTCLFAGIVGSGVAFFVQSWCISRKGPLYTAMFSPLCTVIVTILAALILHEEIYVGSLIGGIGVVLGLYIVLWGKAKDSISMDGDDTKKKILNDDETSNVEIFIDESLKKPLLSINDRDTNVVM